MIDSFTLSGYISHWWTARFPGQIVDAGPLAPVGHGVGMAIGAQLARPGKQVVTVIGDGGIGIGGWDMETAAKYDTADREPCCGTTARGDRASSRCRCSRAAPTRSTCSPASATTRFSRSSAATASTWRARRNRARAATRVQVGKPAVINVVGDKTIGHPTLGGNLLGSTGGGN